MHFRVFADKICTAVQKNHVTWEQLGFKNEAELYRLELNCLAYAMENHPRQAQSFEDWMKPALEAKLKKTEGGQLSIVEADNIVELYPDVEVGVLAA